MKAFILTCLLILVCNNVFADNRVNGYVRHTNGSYVMPYRRTAPDSTRVNNYSGGYVPNPYHAPVQQVETYEPVHVPQINPMTGQVE